MKYELPSLSYDYAALEPVISAEIMELHYKKHHAAYVNNLNTALEKHPELTDQPLNNLLANLTQVPDDIREAVRNHGGGHYNHSLFWESLAPIGQGGQPEAELSAAIESQFGTFDQFREALSKIALGRFGSGWGWLSRKNNGDLIVHSTPNQDTPLAEGLIPLLGVDVWEHAYYLQYKQDRAGYLAAWWQVVNWSKINQRFEN